MREQILLMLAGSTSLMHGCMQGMESKNMKSRADCCMQLADTLEESGIAVLQGRASKRTSGALKRLAAAVAERDAKLRSAALTALMAVFQQEGARLWDLLGEGLPATQMDLVRERSKIVERTLAKKGLAPGEVVRSPCSRLWFGHLVQLEYSGIVGVQGARVVCPIVQRVVVCM